MKLPPRGRQPDPAKQSHWEDQGMHNRVNIVVALVDALDTTKSTILVKNIRKEDRTVHQGNFIYDTELELFFFLFF